MSALFSTVSKVRNGYDPEEVDEFFDHARQVYEGRKPERLTSTDIQVSMFDLVRGGYDTHEVDAALDRLEGAFIARQRAEYVAVNGQQAWMNALAERARSLYGRLGRPDGERFVVSFSDLILGNVGGIAGLSLPIFFAHNVLIALVPVALAFEVRIADDALRRALAGFSGFMRVFTRTG